MAISKDLETQILKVVAGLFNAAPGGNNLTELANLVEGGMTISQLSDALAANTLFTHGIMGGKVTVDDQVAVLMNHFGLAHDGVAGSAASQAEAYFTQKIDVEHVGFGKIVFDAVTFLSPVSPATVPAEFATTATLLANKALVAEAYSATTSSGDLSALQNVLSTVKGTAPYTPADVAAALEGSGSSVTGNTFTLTTNLDTVAGTSGNDTIKGDFANTISAADSVNGGGGTDTLQLFGTYDPAKLPISLSNVEVLDLVNPGADKSINTTGITGLTKLQIDQVEGTGTTTYTTGGGQTLQLQSLAGAVQTGVTTWAGSATDTTQNLILNGFQGAAATTASDLTITGAAATTLNITSQGATPTGSTAANQIATLTAGANTTAVNISGTAGLEITTSLTGAKIATVDASTSTGGVNVNVNGTATNLSFKGGSGNDTVTFGAANTFTTADTVVGGDGTDTLEMQRAQAANTSTTFTNITGFETLKITDATTAADVINLDHFGLQNIAFGAASTATTTVTNIASGASLSLADTGTTALTIKNNTATDSLTIKATGGAVTYTVDASQFETLAFDTSKITGATVFAVTDAQMKTVTLVNTTTAGTNPDFAVDLGTLGVVTSSVDVSAFKAATATNGVTLALSGSAVNGATVVGSANNDTIGGSNQADTITAGNGADTITAGGGADTIDLTETVAAIDNVIFSAAASNGADEIKAFAVGTGIDTATLLKTDTTVATAGAAAVLGASSAALATGGGAYTTTASTTTSDVLEITTTLDSTVTLSATSTGADLLQALSSDTTVASGITATTASDAAFFLVYQNNNAYLFHGDANGGGAGGTSLIEASEIKLVGVFDGVASGAFTSGDIMMSA